MPDHKFHVGQTVFLSQQSNAPGGAYIVTKKLPQRDGEFEYQVRSTYETPERVVRESQLLHAYQGQTYRTFWMIASANSAEGGTFQYVWRLDTQTGALEICLYTIAWAQKDTLGRMNLGSLDAQNRC